MILGEQGASPDSNSAVVLSLFGRKSTEARRLYGEFVAKDGKRPELVGGGLVRSVLCYWAVREPGIGTRELSKRLGISQPTASQSAKRGETIVNENNLELKA